MTKNVEDMINLVFPDSAQKLQKRELAKLLLTQCQDSWLKPFLLALVQEGDQ